MREQALLAAQQAHRAARLSKERLVTDWRADRLALRAFDAQAREGHEAELARSERRIAEVEAVVAQRRKERDEAARALQAARDALARRRAELAKAQNGVTQHQAMERRRDEANEEDELDELAVLRRPAAAFASASRANRKAVPNTGVRSMEATR